MRLFLLLPLLLFLAASATGCGGKSPAQPERPPGVIENPNRPDPQEIKRRKYRLINLRREGAPARIDGKR